MFKILKEFVIIVGYIGAWIVSSMALAMLAETDIVTACLTVAFVFMGFVVLFAKA